MRLLVSTLAVIAAPLSVSCSHEQNVAAQNAASPPVSTGIAASRKLPSPPAPAATSTPVTTKTDEAAIFFDFDSALLRGDARPILQRVAEDMRGKEKEALAIEGNCDELGTVEYNLALGEQRARAAKEYLVHLGVAPGRISTVSYGSERPRFPGHDETARAKNRRDDLLVR
jgi:peptidoglycan-associated lipoprotein